MKNIFTLFCNFIFTCCFTFYSLIPSAFAIGGDFVGNGGGIAEKNFLFALDNIEKYVKMCLEADSCMMDYAQQNLLVLILEAMPKEKRQEQVLRFVSEKEIPGTFQLNGQMKVAKTGSEVGTPIYINSDLIYSKNVFGMYEAVSISQALAILIHEFGHHVTATNCELLDLLGVRVSAFLQNSIQNSPTIPWSPTVSATIVSLKNPNTFPQVLLTVEDDVLDISTDFAHSLYCPSVTIPIPILPVPDISFGLTRPTGAVYHNVHWDKFSENGVGAYKLTGNLTKVCNKDSLFVLDHSFQVDISFQVQRNEKTKKLTLKNKSVQITQQYKPWYKFMPWTF